MKWILKSKTFWAAVSIAALSAFEADVKQWIINHPGLAGSSVAFLMIFLRIITTSALTWKKNPTCDPCEKTDCPRKGKADV